MDYFFELFFIPSLIIIIGILSWKFTPKKNRWLGYRSKKSLLNDDTWNYANKTSGFYWLIVGVIEIIISSIIFFAFYNMNAFNTIKIITFILYFLSMLMVIPYTEIKLKIKFK